MRNALVSSVDPPCANEKRISVHIIKIFGVEIKSGPTTVRFGVLKNISLILNVIWYNNIRDVHIYRKITLWTSHLKKYHKKILKIKYKNVILVSVQKMFIYSKNVIFLVSWNSCWIENVEKYYEIHVYKQKNNISNLVFDVEFVFDKELMFSNEFPPVSGV